MEISVQLASVLAQVMPVFLILLLFERFVLVEPHPEHREQAVWIGHLLRYVAGMLTLIVFVSSLIVVGAGETLVGWPADVLVGALVVLGILLLVTVHMTLETMREKAQEKARQHKDDRAEDEDESDH